MKQPAYICIECASAYARHAAGAAATWHEGECGICGKQKWVASRRDFGGVYLDKLPKE